MKQDGQCSQRAKNKTEIENRYTAERKKNHIFKIELNRETHTIIVEDKIQWKEWYTTAETNQKNTRIG